MDIFAASPCNKFKILMKRVNRQVLKKIVDPTKKIETKGNNR